MNKKQKYYNCFSPNLLAHLLQEGFIPYEQLTHAGTGKHFWRFEMNSKLSETLHEWSLIKSEI